MIVDTPRVLLYCLAATTVLGIVIGYCVALLLAKRRAGNPVAQVQSQHQMDKSATATDLKTARVSINHLRKALVATKQQISITAQREKALEVHSQLQAQRIQTLEAQVASHEDQQIRLQRDFANYKNNKSRELELARNKPDSWSRTDQLPVLNKRIDMQDNNLQVIADSALSGGAESGRSGVRHNKPPLTLNKLNNPLSRELEIPTLSESELADSVDELDFELIDVDSAGVGQRG